MKGGLLLFCGALVAALGLAAGARADDWWPHPSDATWTYQWTDSVYNPTPTKEKVTVKDQKGKSFTLAWTTKDQGNPDGAPVSLGDMSFQETQAGLDNTDWSSNPPPPDLPVLCPQFANCNNSLSSTLYYLIWGSRGPLLSVSLLSGTTWAGSGGADNSVSSTSAYVGVETVEVPAFPGGVLAAKVRSEVTQAGALGDPYGSGIRTVWWVYGVGPVKMTFEHSGGANAPITTAELQDTNQKAKTQPSDANYFPLQQGLKLRYRWTNTKHLKKPSVQEIAIEAVATGTARFSVKNLSGPIKVAGSCIYSTRLDGVTNTSAFTKTATFARFPPLGPSSLQAGKRRHFFTPFDLMNFGLNPILSAYPTAGETWATRNPSRDFSVYGVNGSSRVLGIQKVTVPAGRFEALVVSSTLRQPGFTFGSGTRTCWFVAGKGLVKLVFRHGDGSVSTVTLVK